MQEQNQPIQSDRQRQQELVSAQQQPPQARAAFAGNMTQMAFAQRCPVCGTVNEATATFCEHCGSPLKETVCPHCGAKVDPEADFCEHCHTYISSDRCSFCGAPMANTDEFCQECGSPRKGIVCPTCHSLSHFGFCERCGMPLTDRARIDLEAAWAVDFATEVRTLERQIEELWRTKPVTSKQERARRERNEVLRQRVLQLLRDDGEPAYAQTAIEREHTQLQTPDELRSALEQKRKMLQSLLDRMELQPTTNPAMARNIAMAAKPHLSRLAWRCNFKNALHPSPLACACPQKGGKWVVLTGHEENELS